MIHSLTVTRTLTYSLKLEAGSLAEAETMARHYVMDEAIPVSSVDWEYIHPNGTRHYVPEGAL